MTGLELKNLRKSKGFTQAKLAEISKLSSQVVIARYENGSRNIPSQMALLFKLLLK